MRDIGDVQLAMSGAFESEDSPSVNADAPDLQVWQRPPAATVALFVAAGLGALAVAVFTRSSAQRDLPITTFEVGAPPGHHLWVGAIRQFTLSPDGRAIVYAALADDGIQQLFERRLDRLESTAIPGTVNALTPFFSPDGHRLAFGIRGKGTIGMVERSGGPVGDLCTTGCGTLFGDMGADGTVVLENPSAGLSIVSASGGEPRELTSFDSARGDVGHRWAELLPNGRGVLFTIETAAGERRIAVLDFETGAVRTLFVGTDPQYVATGHVLYGRDNSLWAARFDSERLEAVGTAIAVLQDVLVTSTGSAWFVVSDTGTLAYVPSRAAMNRGLAWVGRDGSIEPIPAPPRSYTYVRLSPDETQVALDIRDQESDIWIWDLARETLQRLTFEAGMNRMPVWTPDGSRVAFSASREGGEDIYWQAADGSGQPERLTAADRPINPNSFSPDGSHLVFMRPTNPPFDIGVTSLVGERPTELLLDTAFSEANADISPDGRWMVYQSNESGQDEIYVRPFPEVGGQRLQISSNGGTRPVWSRDGREVYYYAPPGAIMGVAVQPGDELRPGAASVVVRDLVAPPRNSGRHYDVASDGRFLVITDDEDDTAAIVLVENWTEELKRLVPTP